MHLWLKTTRWETSEHNRAELDGNVKISQVRKRRGVIRGKITLLPTSRAGRGAGLRSQGVVVGCVFESTPAKQSHGHNRHHCLCSFGISFGHTSLRMRPDTTSGVCRGKKERKKKLMRTNKPQTRQLSSSCQSIRNTWPFPVHEEKA